MKALLAGGTGLIGRQVLQAAQPSLLEICTVGRRPTGKVAHEIVASFSQLQSLPAADVAICALGTTIRRAGSRDAFRAVDYQAVLNFATAAKAAGVPQFIVVTAVGANSRSSMFYSRVKGEVEQDLKALKFARLDIVRPGLLMGDRQENRPVESLLKWLAPLTDRGMLGRWRRYRSIHAQHVAQFLLCVAGSEAPGVFIHHFDEMMSPPQTSEADVT